MTHLNYAVDLYWCKLFDVWYFFFSDEILKYLSERKDRYHWLVVQDDQEDSCDILYGKETMIGNETSEFV